MNSEKFLMFNLEDDSSKKLGEIISNETARKILNLVAEKELSQGDISRELKLPLNTIGYNIEKLLKAGLINEIKSFWSVKGKKIPIYTVARKHIIISPKKTYPSRIGTIIPVIIVALIFSVFILFGQGNFARQNFSQDKSLPMLESVSSVATGASNIVPSSSGLEFLDWFLIGIWAVIAGFVVYSWKKK